MCLPSEDLPTEPPTRADSVENDVAGNFENDNTNIEQLLSNIVIGLGDADVFEEVVGQSVTTKAE